MTDHDKEQYETLANGVASIVDESDDEDGAHGVRIVPIGEGEITRGGSKKKTYWDSEVLKEAVEEGAFDDAKLLKGRPGAGHKGMLEQASPDEIVGSAGEFDYEDGVGPVAKNGDLLDDHMAQLVEHGLIEVSPDMWRVLGDYDEELGAYRVEEILDVPYITLLDSGASDGSAIEPAEAEALGATEHWWADRVDALAETLGVAPDAIEDFEAGAEQLARLMTLRFRAYGEMFGDEFLDEAVDNLEAIAGISAARSAGNDDPELIVIIDREAVESLDDLNDQLISALEDTPFEVHDDYDWVQDVARPEVLAAQADDDDVGAGSGASTTDEPAESGTGSQDPGSGSGSTSAPNMADPEELQEQLAEVRSDKDDLEGQLDTIREQLADDGEQIEDVHSAVEDVVEENEQLAQQVDDLEDEIEPLAEMLAGLAAESSPLSAESIAEKYDPSELVESLALEAGWDPDADDADDPIEIVREQLAGSPAPRGEGGDPEGGAGNLSEEELEHAEQLADGVLVPEDRLAMNGESAYEFLRQEYDVDASEFDDEAELREAVRGTGGEGE